MLVASPCDILHGLLPSFCSSLFPLSISPHWVSHRLVSVKLPQKKTKNPPTQKRHHVTNTKEPTFPSANPQKKTFGTFNQKKTYPAEKWIVKSWARYQRKMQIDLLQSAVDLWPFRDKHGDLLPLKRWRWETAIGRKVYEIPQGLVGDLWGGGGGENDRENQ